MGGAEKIHKFEEMLCSVLKDTVSMPEWSLEHFLCMAIPLQSQCTLMERLKEKRIFPHGYTGYIIGNDVPISEAEFRVMSAIPSVNNMPSGKKNVYALVQEAPGASPSGLYFIEKRFKTIYIVPLTFLPNKDMSCLTLKLFPKSKDNVYSHIKDLSFEQLNEISLSTGHKQIEKGRIYIQSEESFLKYTLKVNSEEIITDKISKDELTISINEPLDNKKLNIIWPEIMGITFRRGHTQINLHGQSSYEIHYRSVNRPEDLKSVIGEMLYDYDETLEHFRSLVNISQFDFSMPPIKWLEQCHCGKNTIGKYVINSRPMDHKYRFNMPLLMKTIILSHHFQLDAEKVMNQNGVLDSNRCKIIKAAEILNVDVENVISECQKKGLGVYLQKGKFKIDSYTASPITVENINQNRKTSYDYCYKGLVRLLDGSVDYFYEDDVIKCKDNDSYRMVNLQPSLGQLIQGITVSHILLRRNESIVRDDCFFIQEELMAHVTGNKEAGIINKEKSAPKTRKHLLKALMIKTYLGEMEKLKREPTAGEVWDALRAEPHVALCHPALGDVQKNQKALYGIDEIIQEMDDRVLGWRNRDGKDKIILFTSFETKLSKMKSEINLPILNT